MIRVDLVWLILNGNLRKQLFAFNPQ